MAGVAGNKIAGVNVLVKVGSPAVVVGGQSGATLNRSASMIETTDKQSNNWVTKIAGAKEWGVDADAFMVLSDAAYTTLSTAFKNGTPVDVEMSTGTGTGHLTWKGQAYITDFPVEFAQDDAVTFSLSLEGTGELLETPSV
ncbi:phage tail tube protein [Priestia megaterium]